MTQRRPRAGAGRRVRGATLVELVMFIVIVAVVAVTMMGALGEAVRSAPLAQEITQALQLAQGRMELILAQRRRLGFAAFTGASFDPCALGAPDACVVPDGFAVTAALANSWNGDSNYKVITVTVAGADGNPLASLAALVANY